MTREGLSGWLVRPGTVIASGLSGFQLLATVLSQKSVSDSSPGDSPVKPPEGSTGKSKDPALLAWQAGGPYIALALLFPFITRCCSVPASSSPCWASIWGAASQEAGICLSLRGQGTGPGQLQEDLGGMGLMV